MTPTSAGTFEEDNGRRMGDTAGRGRSTYSYYRFGRLEGPRTRPTRLNPRDKAYQAQLQVASAVVSGRDRHHSFRPFVERRVELRLDSHIASKVGDHHTSPILTDVAGCRLPFSFQVYSRDSNVNVESVFTVSLLDSPGRPLLRLHRGEARSKFFLLKSRWGSDGLTKPANKPPRLLVPNHHLHC